MAGVHVSPDIDFTAEIAINILSGIMDLGGRIIAEQRSSNQFGIPIQQDDNGEEQKYLDLTCGNDVEFRSKLQFSIIGFVTTLWKKMLYGIERPNKDECISL